MAMRLRSFVSQSAYRYGYQGSEKESGVAGMYTTDFRMLDVRIGRWFIPDPIFDPSVSPYSSMDNNPIALNDGLGLSTGGGGGTKCDLGGSCPSFGGSNHAPDAASNNIGGSIASLIMQDQNNFGEKQVANQVFFIIGKTLNTKNLKFVTEQSNGKNPHLINSNTNVDNLNSEDDDITITFGPKANEESVSDYTEKILRKLGKESKNDNIYISSSRREPSDQARIMYKNIKNNYKKQRKIYKAPGQKIIDVYDDMKAKEATSQEIMDAMTKKIIEIGPRKISQHLASPTEYDALNVIDIPIESLDNPEDFKKALEDSGLNIKILIENGCYHLQIPQLNTP